MTSPKSKRPMNWDDYEAGRTSPHGSFGSNSGRPRFGSRISPSATSSYRTISQQDGTGAHNGEGGLQRRRSSISMRINSIRQAGGVNSLDNFARSWQRAAGFHEIAPGRRSFVVTESDESGGDERDEEHGQKHTRSLLRQQIEQASVAPSEAAIEEEEEDDGEEASSKTPLLSDRRPSGQRFRSGESAELLSSRSPFGSSYEGSFGGGYGTISARLNESSRRRATQIYESQSAPGTSDDQKEPVPLKEVEREDGTKAYIIVGRSTLPQTVFNSSNVLIGIGMLSLPLGIKYAGWIVGMPFLLFSALVTRYTATLLAKCLDVDDSLVTFADLAFISFGERARIATSLLFSFELVAACVALVVLFADSLYALIPGLGLLEWKIICGLILTPINFVPLRLLSFSSILGIMCCLSLVGITFIDGFIKPRSPGSLRHPATTYLFPANWGTLPLSFGLLMSPWGGHSVFPNIYRDMRHPQKYEKSLKITFTFTYLLDLSMAVAGLLMFGDSIRDEVTSNLVTTEGYPHFLKIVIVVLIAIIPLTKVPLSTAPISSTMEILIGLDPRASPDARLANASNFTRKATKIFIRLFTILLITILACVVPSFDRIMALMGSALCFTICIIMPISFYLKIFGKDISLRERILDWFLIVICGILAIIGTTWAFIPKDKIGAAPKAWGSLNMH